MALTACDFNLAHDSSCAATSCHGIDTAGFCGLLHERHRDVELQVFEFVEIDAATPGLHLAELGGIPLDEVAILAADTNVEAIVAFPRSKTDQEPVAFATAGGPVAILAVTDDWR